MKIPNSGVTSRNSLISLARIVSEDSQHPISPPDEQLKSSKDS